MRTNFTPTQLTNPYVTEAERNLRVCVHCGICTATCPTYVLLGDERDGPRGRIVMIQNMLEAGVAPSAETVVHVDRCLSCLACRTACPSGVDYARLIDEARVHIQTTYRRPFGDKMLRWFIATVMTRPALVRAGLFMARCAAPFAFLLPGRLALMTAMGAHVKMRPPAVPPRAILANAKRIALMPGCVQAALAPQIDQAVERCLARRGYELVPLEGAGCCGSLVHHLGRSEDAKNWARRAIEAFEQAGSSQTFDGVLITATGCSAYLKDLPNLFLDEPSWLSRARAFAQASRDFLDLIQSGSGTAPRRLRVAWQAPCSLQNGLRLAAAGEAVLVGAGFDVLTIPEGHLCCGSAGSYSILQPEISGRLRARKLGNIAALNADVIATSNIGCLNHLAGSDAPPVVHLAELLDWAEGGPEPLALSGVGG